MNIKEFSIVTFDEGNDYQRKPKIVCNDGFTMSVQGSTTHYCQPRDTVSHYLTMEIGFPSVKEELIMPFVEDETRPTDTVYARVPCEIIDDVLKKHGGINIEKTFSKK